MVPCFFTSIVRISLIVLIFPRLSRVGMSTFVGEKYRLGLTGSGGVHDVALLYYFGISRLVFSWHKAEVQTHGQQITRNDTHDSGLGIGHLAIHNICQWQSFIYYRFRPMDKR
ncbi:protein of unknown function [Serratia sp. Tan611]|nr:protein of unknown function [Serratia sp. Tan611]